MNKKELNFILECGEGQFTEFKESFSDSLSKDICAFANANGGRILLGVTDNRQIKGIEITNRLKSQIHDLVRNFDPKLTISIEEFENIFIINVPEGKNKPYSANGRFYMRQGTNSQQLTRDEIREFFQKEGLVIFDEKINDEFDLNNDFSTTAYNTFLERTKISKVLKKEEILSNMGLIEKGNIKNAGVLVFCNSVTKFFLNATITCVLFQGDDKVNILDRKEFENDIYLNYQNAVEYLKAKLNTEYIIKGTGPRKEILELPEEALREAILNAIAHRDYFSNANIQIYIFKDRVEIVNPGGLVPGIKLSDLGKKSLSRNKLLFGLMQRMNLVEKIGSGILRIREWMTKYKLKYPKIETDENWFSITFNRPDMEKESWAVRFGMEKTKGGQVGGQISGQILTERQEEIIRVIAEKPDISREALAERLNINQSAVQKHIVKLKEKGLLERVGPDKGGHWKIKKKR